MGAEVGVLAADTEHGKQTEGRRDRQGPAPAWAQILTVAHHADGGQDADRAEDRGGGTDCSVSRVLQPGVNQITECPGGQQQQPARAGAQVTTKA